MNARLPLTEAQTALWLAHCLDPDSPALSTAQYVEVAAPVRVRLLIRAIRVVLRETEALRLVFGSGHDGPWQAIGAPRDEVELIDLSRQPDDAAALIRARAWMDDELAGPARLEDARRDGRDPVQHAAVIVLPGGRVLWYQRVHHIAADGYAVSLITSRVAAIYSAMCAGNRFRPAEPGGLPRLVQEDRRYRAGTRPEIDRRFWTGLLSGVPTAVSLSEHTAPAAASALTTTGLLDDAAFGALTSAAKRAGQSWPDLLIAAHAAYLHAMTGSAVPVIGLAMMNRLGTGAAELPAMVMNIATLPVAMGADDTLAGLAGRVAALRGQIRRHAAYRYEQLRRDLGRVGEGRRLFGPLVNIIGFAPSPHFGDSPSSTHVLSTGPVEDINITWRVGQPVGSPATLRLDIDANPACYCQPGLDAHRDRLLALLGVGDALLDVPVRELSVLTPGERHLLLHSWNDTAHPVPDTTLAALLAEQAARTPDAPAIRATNTTLSYAELHVWAASLATRLAAHGAGPGQRVAVSMPRSAELVVALVAVLACGAAYVPVDPDYPRARIDYLLGDARPVRVLRHDDVAEARGAPVAGTAFTPARPADPAYVIYTSGSTGEPKGAVVSHRAIVNRLLWMQHAYQLAPGERVLQKTPSSFDVSVWEFFWPLITGGTLVLARPGGHQDPAYLSEIIRSESISTMHFVPSMLRAFLDEPSSAACAGTLRQVMCSGEALPADLARRFLHTLPGVALHNLYGPTEAAVDVTHWTCAPDEDDVPIGRPVWNTRLYVLDPALRPVPVGVPGQLHLAGRQLAEGYLDRAELTAERFVPDPFAGGDERMYATGDLVSWRHDGAVRFHGRIDDQIKLRGMRVELGEVEAALRALPGIGAAAAALRAGGRGDQRLVGYVVAEGGFDPAEARGRLVRTLPEHLIPATLQVIKALPLSPSGKLDRAALPEPDAVAAGAGVADTPRLELVCRLMAETLGRERVGADDNFFDLGGHSLLAVALAQRLSAAFDSAVTIGTVFGAPSARALAAALGGAGSDRSVAPLLRLRDGTRTPLWCVHPAGGLGWCYTGLLPVLPRETPVFALQAPGLSGASAPESMRELAAGYVADVLAVQPTGPYQVLGWSVGGVIAHAMAAELSRRGHAVTLLGLLDAYPAEQWQGLAPPGEADALRALLHIGGISPESLDRLDRSSVIDALAAAGSALATLDPATVDTMIDVVLANNRLMRTHSHEPVATDALMFTATAPRSETWLDPRGWRDHVTGALEFVDLPCSHPQVISPAMLAVIGDALGDRLCRA